MVTMYDGDGHEIDLSDEEREKWVEWFEIFDVGDGDGDGTDDDGRATAGEGNAQGA